MLRRACDSCRRRKIKCDLTSPPCLNCRTTGIDCTHDDPPRKRGPKTKRSFPVPSSSSSPQLDPHPHPDIGPVPALHGSAPNLNVVAQGHSGLSITNSPLQQLQSPQSIQYESPTRSTAGPIVTDYPTSLLNTTSVEPAARQVRSDLIEALNIAMPSVPIEDIVDECISLYMQYSFPICSFVYEPRLRANVFLSLPDSSESHVSVNKPSLEEHIYAMRSFTLVTAICAITSLNVPFELFADGHRLEHSFLASSRAMFKLYEDYDIEHPDWTSMAIRLLQSAALHTCGKTGRSWHSLGEVRLIASSLYIPSRSVAAINLDPLEAQMRRFNYWISRLAERSALVLNNRQVDLRTPIFERSLELLFAAPENLPLLDQSKKHNAHPFEERLLTGVDLCCRLWLLGTDLITSMQSGGLQEPTIQSTEGGLSARLTETYIEFMTVLDKMPPWLESPESIVCPDEEIYHYQKTCFSRQRTDLLVTFHCLRIVVLQHAITLGFTAVLGFRNDSLTLALQKTQIACDLIHVLDSVPLQSLQLGGEPCVEKIRQVGSIMLEVMTQPVQNKTVEKRAKDCFTQLLNYLTQLNSRVSMELNNDYKGLT